jgi:glycerate dehydrogenase
MKRRLRIVVLDGYTLNPGDNPWDEVAEMGELVVHERTAPQLVVDRATGADIVLTNKTPVRASDLERLPELRYISVLATGYNIVDVRAAAARGIPVSNVPVYGTDAVAQFVFALLLELCHQVGLHDRAVRDGQWGASGDFAFWKSPLVELAGRTMAVVGFGRIGRRVGELAHAFGMKVLAVDPAARPAADPAADPASEATGRAAPAYQPFAWAGLEEACREADVVSLNCTLTPENEGFVNARLLRLMKPTAFLVNAARGQLVDEAALAEALSKGWLAGAALDVVSVEPIRPDNPLLGAPNCVLTPHIAWAALEARQRLMRTTAENIRSFLAGAPQNRVN